QKANQSNQAKSTAPEPEAKPSSRRTSRRDAAQAQEKKKKQLQMIIGGVAAAVIIAVVFILVNRPTSSGIEIDYSDVEIAQSDVVQNVGTPSAGFDASTLDFATGSTVGDPDDPVTMHVYSDFQCNFCK